MTTERDLTMQLSAWFDECSTSVVSDGLLDRSLERVETTRQRPGWMSRVASPVVPQRARPLSFAPTWAVVLVALLAALAALAAVTAGARLLNTPRPALLADASRQPSFVLVPSTRPDATSQITPDTGPLGGRLILAEVFKGRDVQAPHDVVSVDARTGAQTLLGTIQDGRSDPVSSAAHPVSFQRTVSDHHVLVLGGDAPHVGQLTDAGRAYGLIVPDDLILDLPDSPWPPILSPTGTRIAYVHADASGAPAEVIVRDADGGASSTVAIPESASEFALIAWAPDESALLGYGCRPCNKAATPQAKQTPHHTHLYVLPLDGSPAGEVGDVDNGWILGSWTPDSRSLLTQTSMCMEGTYMPRCDPSAANTNLFGTLRVSDGETTALAADPADGTGFFEYRVSPDATRVVYRTNNGLFVRNIIGSAAVKIGATDDFWADWSPDSEWILFQRSTKPSTTPTELWIVPASGGEPRLIGTDLAGAAW